jgi:hypothetical protein
MDTAIARCGTAASRAGVVAVKDLLIVQVGRCMLAVLPWLAGRIGENAADAAACCGELEVPTEANDHLGGLPKFRLEPLNDRLAPMAVIPGRLVVTRMQTFGEMWR